MKVVRYKDLENAFGYMAPELKLDSDEIMYMIDKLPMIDTDERRYTLEFMCRNCGSTVEIREQDNGSDIKQILEIMKALIEAKCPNCGKECKHLWCLHEVTVEE